jgi:hypothetical protein
MSAIDCDIHRRPTPSALQPRCNLVDEQLNAGTFVEAMRAELHALRACD